MQAALVTIVVPIYNVEKYLNRCVESVVNQTYNNLEIILVDDGSPDNCPLLCDEWAKKDKRIKVIHKENAGLGMARNTGIEHAMGDFICFFDSDDYIQPETIEKCVDMAQKYQTEIVYFGRTILGPAGNVIDILIPKLKKNVYTGEEIRQVILPELLSFDPHTGKKSNLSASACFSMYSLQIIRENNWRFVSEREVISEDMYSTLKLYQYISKIAIISDSFYNYCMNANSFSHTYRKDRYAKIKTFYKKSVALCNQLKYGEEVKHRLLYPYISFTIAALEQIAASDELYKDKISLIKSILDDEQLQTTLKKIRNDYCNMGRRILFFVMQKHWYGICMILLLLKNKSKDII